LPLAQVRRQFDTNLFGLARLTQLVMPACARPTATRSSTCLRFGRFAVPGNAYYAATKHAVAAFADASG
jgi:NADP-dependent 3-hydroxy acid dehydrogenase YdfG